MVFSLYKAFSEETRSFVPDQRLVLSQIMQKGRGHVFRFQAECCVAKTFPF